MSVNNDGTYNVGLWQINSVNWDSWYALSAKHGPRSDLSS